MAFVSLFDTFTFLIYVYVHLWNKLVEDIDIKIVFTLTEK